jgi:regulation of enolase protein 1 (concanavalin A-like superfamily)
MSKAKAKHGKVSGSAAGDPVPEWLRTLSTDDSKKKIEAFQQISKWSEQNAHRLLDGQAGGKLSHRLMELLLALQNGPMELLLHVISCIKHIAAAQVGSWCFSPERTSREAVFLNLMEVSNPCSRVRHLRSQ